MRKRFLVIMNVLLGALSLALVGCHTTKQPQRPMVKYGVPPEMQKVERPTGVVAMYGVRPVVIEQPVDTTAGAVPAEGVQ